MIREPVVAGQFYPAEKGELRSIVKHYLDVSVPVELSGGCRGLIVPHAGYVYSGPVAGMGYACLSQLPQDRHYTVVVLAPSHQVYFVGAALPAADVLRTPLGDIPVAPEALRLPGKGHTIVAEQVHAFEHAVEVQLPFLQLALKDFSVIPLVLGEADPQGLARDLVALGLPDMLVVASSDLSHYASYAAAVDHDHRTLDRILHGEGNLLGGEDACGFMPIQTLLTVASTLHWQPHLLQYQNSGDTAGDRAAVVGYGAVGFTEERTR